MSASNPGILLVEDDPNDVFFMERAISKARLNLPVHVASTGEEAISYLGGEGKYADRASFPMPACVFLDLKLPFLTGFEVLEWMRSQPALSRISVIVLTSSAEERDRQKAAQLGAKAYVVKPPTPQMLLDKLAHECGGARA